MSAFSPFDAGAEGGKPSEKTPSAAAGDAAGDAAVQTGAPRPATDPEAASAASQTQTQSGREPLPGFGDVNLFDDRGTDKPVFDMGGTLSDSGEAPSAGGDPDLDAEIFGAPVFDGAAALAGVLSDSASKPDAADGAPAGTEPPVPSDGISFDLLDKASAKPQAPTQGVSAAPEAPAGEKSEKRAPQPRDEVRTVLSPLDGRQVTAPAAGGDAPDFFTQPVDFGSLELNNGDFSVKSFAPDKGGPRGGDFVVGGPERGDGTDLFRMVDELRNAVIVKNFSRAFTENNLMREGQNTALRVENISSTYYISEGGAPATPMCEGISFSLKAGSCCALVSDIKLTAYAVAREIAERCENPADDSVIAGEDAQHSREVLYIGSDSCLPLDLSCLEFMMYTQSCVTGEQSEESETSKKRLGIMLSQLGLSDIETVPLKEAPYNKRILIIAAAAALNPHIGCVIINDPRFDVGPQDDMLARRVFTLLSNRGKCAILSCCSHHLISSVANRVAVLKGGALVFFGSYKSFIDQNCRRLLSFPCERAAEVSGAIEREFPSIAAGISGGLVCLSQRPSEDTVDFEQLLNELTSQGVDSGSIVLEEKNFDIALKEVLSR